MAEDAVLEQTETEEEQEEIREATTAQKIVNSTAENTPEKMQRRRRITMAIITFMSILLAMGMIIGCAMLFFRVKNIVVEGAATYGEAEISSASGIAFDSSLYSLDKDAIRQSIIMNYPYVRSVRVVRRLPTTIALIVTEDVPVYFFALSDEYYVLSEDLRVLERTTDRTALLSRWPDLVELATLPVRTAIVGKELEFISTTAFDYAHAMLDLFLNSDIADHITYIDFSSRFDVKVTYDDRLTIEFGSVDNLEMKLNFALNIMETIDERYQATINVENDEAYVIITRTY